MQDILPTVERWLQRGDRVALATVVSTWGSSPRQAGAKLAVTPDMAMIGSVSGGCVEAAVIQEALDALEDSQPRLLHFGVSDDTAWDVGLACGGMIDVLVEPLDAHWWAEAAKLVNLHHGFVTVTVLDGDYRGCKLLIDSQGAAIYGSSKLPETLHAGIIKAIHDNQNRRQSGRRQISVGSDALDILVDVFHPQPRLLIVGGAHVALALAKFAKMMGWYVALDDPRKIFAAEERFPDVDEMSHKYPDEALPIFGIDSDSYVAILTHDPKIDDPALRVVLSSDAPYIGILSSKRAHQARIERLTGTGMPPALLEGLHVPVGLSIGANTPEEIALCIMAEIVAVRNGVQPRRKVPAL